ncbi:CRISPR-associated helicase Cas3' [Alkalihalobacillus oceani]|uniref:CRISPR-associated helicase Cas3 n=1 Tax=Halalkalibacter oceani TaxID=1653776 RepID=A0A9X2DTQ1_9BACI|nr:CRISPR-associated helicase Cas3' [Halalkalibacter oceani]MCM3715950.1 CRISPR-associated helicase Cas3' [Halalkalibacter oceani]
MKFYAKSSPIETIKEHTKELLKRYSVLKKIYYHRLPLDDRDWELLRIAVLYHDIGKADTFFQNKIRKVIGEPLLLVKSEFNVQHNFLSILAIPFKRLGILKEEQKLLMQIIAYHHERGQDPNNEEAASNYEHNILPFREELEAEMELSLETSIRSARLEQVKHQARIREYEPELFRRYVLLKGLLHRLDHAASAHVPIEVGLEMNVVDHVNQFFNKKFEGRKKPLQHFTEQNQDKHLVVVAQTGMGKTEAGLLWLGKEKGFFTLPLRVSINAMYERVTSNENIGFSLIGGEGIEEATGLLHSTSLDYLYDRREADDEALEKMHSQSREFANKLTISTIDQVLKFPFYYLGFEKEYATVVGAKVIIDELQAYDPRIAALLVRAMVLLDELGGAFLIMTATLPDFYFKALERELSSSKRPLVYQEFIDDEVKRHHIHVREETIFDAVEEIARAGEMNKVLVICNTVDQARKVFKQIHLLNEESWLLHARFIQKDRRKKEKEILAFANSERAGIWVTTQLVEASLDIDFDRLYTEMATLDSLFQRFGRCNRKGTKPIEAVNIHVMAKEVSGVGSVYHEEIYQRSLRLIQLEQGLLVESKKHAMIQELYNEEALQGSNFKQQFDDTLKELKNRPLYETKKLEAQKLLRDIQQVQAIPERYIGSKEVQDALHEWEQATKQTKQKNQVKAIKRKARRQIEQFTVGVNPFKAKELLGEFPLIKGLCIIRCEYDEDLGLLIDQKKDPFS